MIIKISDQDVAKCQKFATSINTEFYTTRNQFNKDKRITDQVIGKLGELATFNYFNSKKIELTAPDFKIYLKKDKSWDYDLKNDICNIHVKTQNISSSKKYATSWMFEKSDKHVFKDIHDNDYVSFVVVDLEQKTAEIKALLKLTDLHKYELFKKPKLDYLITKTAVYFDDLKLIFNNELHVL